MRTMARPTSKEYDKYEKAMNKALGGSESYEENVKAALGKATAHLNKETERGKHYGQGHDMKLHGEGVLHGQASKNVDKYNE